MATATAAKAIQLSEHTSIPCSFTEALKQGWRIISDKSKSARGMRCGSLTLALNGRRVSVFYVGDKDGYGFGSVKAVR